MLACSVLTNLMSMNVYKKLVWKPAPGLWRASRGEGEAERSQPCYHRESLLPMPGPAGYDTYSSGPKEILGTGCKQRQREPAFLPKIQMRISD